MDIVNFINVLMHKCKIISQLFLEGAFIRDLSLIKNVYTVVNNGAITKDKLTN